MSDSLQPHRWQPIRLRCPWDSPGKNTGVGCHFLLQCMEVKSESEVALSGPTLRDPMDCSLPGSFVHGISQARVLEWGAIAFSPGRHWNPLKEIPHFQKQRRNHSEMVGGVGIPRECDFGGQWDLITRLPQDWEKQTLCPWRAYTNSCAHQGPGGRSSDPTGD